MISVPDSSIRGVASRRSFLRTLGVVLAAPAAACAADPPPVASGEKPLSSQKTYVMTVRGPLAAEYLGFTLPHEHVLITHATNPDRNLTDPEAAVRELALYSVAGGRSLVDMTNVGIQRDPTALRAISERTGVNIVMGAGFYKDKWLPAETHGRSVEELTAEIVRDIEVGVDGTGIRAGIIGEIGISSTRQAQGRTATELRVLRAAGRAQRITGAGINIHFDIGGDLAEHESALDILADEGADLVRVALSHFLPNTQQIPHFHRIAERGCFVEFDLFGQEKCSGRKIPSADEMNSVIHRLVADGLASHLLLSQDVCFKGCLVENGGYGYAHLLRNILPGLRSLGVDAAAIHTMTVENPRRLLALQPKI